MPRPKTPAITPQVVQRCRLFVIEAAEIYGVPPAYITAHVPGPSAHKARLEVWRRMYEEIGLRRHQIARFFGRDLRRVRASVLKSAPERRWMFVGDQLVWSFVATCRSNGGRRASATTRGLCPARPTSARMEQMVILFRNSALRARCRAFDM